MTSYKLTYFDMDGGRGEPLRIALHAAGIDFEDHRISFEDFMKLRADMRFRCSPTMEIDGKEFSQSNALGRFIGKKTGLYPEDNLQALYCDEVMGALEDLLHQVVKTFGLEGDALKTAREELTEQWIKPFLKGFDELLTRGGGKYFAGDQLTMADLKMLMQIRFMTSGNFDHVPVDLVEKVAPSLIAHRNRMEEEPVIKAYYASRS